MRDVVGVVNVSHVVVVLGLELKGGRNEGDDVVFVVDVDDEDVSPNVFFLLLGLELKGGGIKEMMLLL